MTRELAPASAVVRPRASRPPLANVAVFSRGIQKTRFIERLIGAERLVFNPSLAQASGLDAVVGWGHKPSAHVARTFAVRAELPYLRLEDGFLRSAGPGSKGHPLSLVVDPLGIYYDASQTSYLEGLLNEASPELESPELLARAAGCRAAIVEAGLSKYNHAIGRAPEWLELAPRPRLLVIDQTEGDASVTLGQASRDTFHEMLEAALSAEPEATVIVKTHPDVWGLGKRGYLSRVNHPRVRLIQSPVDPARLLDLVDRVYTVTSQLGFEALLRQKPVTCFGMPFYAGWGLTEDRQVLPRRLTRRTLEQLLLASLILYPRYVHPVTGQTIELEQAIEHLALQRSAYEANRAVHFCFGFSKWKQRYVRQYLASPEGRVEFCRSVEAARQKGIDAESRIVVWGNRAPASIEALANDLEISVARMEDGFLRSVGLGSDLSAPLSLVLDRRGIYYDPTRASDLECLLEQHRFSEAELAEARTLTERIVSLRLSKYNFDAEPTLRLEPPPGRRVILVPGQVPDDASILLGSPELTSDAELLARVREQNPEAYVLYKVHPDVLSGNRGRGFSQPAPHLYDELLRDVPLAECLRVADEVHTMTSLVGFEALLRNKRVVTYGRPFYAGWGLTEDRVPPERRGRRLTLDELVAGALLLYPRYYSWSAQAFTRPEDVLDELKAERVLGRARQPSSRSVFGRSLRRASVWLGATRPRPARPLARALEGKHLLLLQGPVGPFFEQLGRELELAGAEVSKLNFNAGDDYFYRRPGVVRYEGTLEEWPHFFARFLERFRFDALLLFGDRRQLHHDAIQQAELGGLPVYVFEEGYVRPDYVTMEQGGVNARSTLPKELGPYLERAERLGLGKSRKVQKVEHGFRMLAWYSVLYALTATLGGSRYPKYQHHKDINAFRQTLVWGRGFMRKAYYRVAERGVLGELRKLAEHRFFLVPLQVHHDSQVVHSSFGSNEAFIEAVLSSFATHAERDVLLVFKHHPLDRAYRDYGRLIASETARLGLDGRVVYVHDVHLPSLLRAACGTVVLNSTTGSSSLFHGTPVKVLGAAVYDIEGLTYRGSLAEFWKDPGKVDRLSFEAYRDALIDMSQINGCFYSMDIASQVVARLVSELGATSAESLGPRESGDAHEVETLARFEAAGQ